MAETDETRVRPTPLRSLAEIAALAAYLVLVPPQLDRAANAMGYEVEGLLQVAGTCALYVGFFALAILLTKLKGQTVAGLGLRWPSNRVRSAVIGVGVALLFFAAVEVMKRTGIMTSDWSDAALWRNNVALLLAWVAMITIFTGVIEEFVYRGFLMDRIAGAFGGGRAAWVAALFGQAVLFALAHAFGNLELVLFAGAFAIAYGLMYLGDGKSLLAPIVAHVVYDVGRVVFFFYVATYGDPL